MTGGAITALLVATIAPMSTVASPAGILDARLVQQGSAPQGSIAQGSTPPGPPPQGPATITEAATAFVRELHGDDPTLAVDGGTLDPRLRLAACSDPLDAALAAGSHDVGRVTVQVRCPGTPAWRVHVQLDVSRERTLWTLTRAARRGEALVSSMIESLTSAYGRREAATLRSRIPVEDPERWLGQEFARDTAAGQVLVTTMLEAPRLIQRGDVVRLRATGPGLAIETSGTALADAVLGARVSVRNSVSGRIVEGQAIESGVVAIGNGARAVGLEP